MHRMHSYVCVLHVYLSQTMTLFITCTCNVASCMMLIETFRSLDFLQLTGTVYTALIPYTLNLGLYLAPRLAPRYAHSRKHARWPMNAR